MALTLEQLKEQYLGKKNTRHTTNQRLADALLTDTQKQTLTGLVNNTPDTTYIKNRFGTTAFDNTHTGDLNTYAENLNHNVQKLLPREKSTFFQRMGHKLDTAINKLNYKIGSFFMKQAGYTVGPENYQQIHTANGELKHMSRAIDSYHKNQLCIEELTTNQLLVDKGLPSFARYREELLHQLDSMDTIELADLGIGRDDNGTYHGAETYAQKSYHQLQQQYFELVNHPDKPLTNPNFNRDCMDTINNLKEHNAYLKVDALKHAMAAYATEHGLKDLDTMLKDSDFDHGDLYDHDTLAYNEALEVAYDKMCERYEHLREHGALEFITDERTAPSAEQQADLRLRQETEARHAHAEPTPQTEFEAIIAETTPEADKETDTETEVEAEPVDADIVDDTPEQETHDEKKADTGRALLPAPAMLALTAPDTPTPEETINNIDASVDKKRLGAAAKEVITTQKGSITNLKKVLRVGHKKALQAMNQLEQLGVVGEAQTNRARTVLVGVEKLEHILGQIETRIPDPQPTVIDHTPDEPIKAEATRLTPPQNKTEKTTQPKINTPHVTPHAAQGGEKPQFTRFGDTTPTPPVTPDRGLEM